MKNLILKIVLFACIAFTSIESKAYETRVFWVNTTSTACTPVLTLNIYDIFNNLLFSSSTCCTPGGVCFSSTNIPDHCTITAGGTCTTGNFNVNSTSTTCTSATCCNCLATAGAIAPGNVQYASTFSAGSTCPGFGPFNSLTVTAL